MTHYSSTNLDTGFMWVPQPALQDLTSNEENIFLDPADLTTNNAEPETHFQDNVLDLNTSAFHQQSQSRSSSSAITQNRRRERNSLAARKYRQRRLDRIEELEQALAETERERDSLKMQVERWKTKAELLQELTHGVSKG